MDALQLHGIVALRALFGRLPNVFPAQLDRQVRNRFEPRGQQLRVLLRPDRRPADQLRIAVDPAQHGLERRQLADPAQIPDHVCIVHGIGTHEDRKLAPGDGERRAGAFAFRAHEIGGEEGARGLRRRGRAGFDPPLQYRRKPVEQRNLRVVDLDLALPAEHVEERHRGIGENLEPHGGALPASGSRARPSPPRCARPACRRAR